VVHRGVEAAGHTFQTNFQFPFLFLQGRFQYPLEDLFVTHFQGLLDGLIRIKHR